MLSIASNSRLGGEREGGGSPRPAASVDCLFHSDAKCQNDIHHFEEMVERASMSPGRTPSGMLASTIEGIHGPGTTRQEGSIRLNVIDAQTTLACRVDYWH